MPCYDPPPYYGNVNTEDEKRAREELEIIFKLLSN